MRTRIEPNREKTAIELQKLRLEEQLLKRQLSTAGVLIEWLKAAAVPVALIGTAITFYLGFSQINQAEQNRRADRFDKALTRLASDKATERITGISGLRLFLSEPGSHLQGQALQFLVNAAAVEADKFVQSAIMDAFTDLQGLKLNQPDLDEALKSAIENNRSLTKTIRDGHYDSIAEAKRTILAKSLKLQIDEIPKPIPKRLVAKLSQQSYLDFVETDKGVFDRLDPPVGIRLSGLARLIPILLGLGARSKDFSDIYCMRCDFSGAGDLSGANFANSFLRGANFSHVGLSKASFKDADLSGTIFFAANLSNADLRERFAGSSHRNESFPLFECADLRGADLSGMTLLTFARKFNTQVSGEQAMQIRAPAMLLSQIDERTTLTDFTIVSSTDISDAYLLKHPNDTSTQPLHSNFEDLAENPILTGWWTSVAYRRFHGDFAIDETNWNSTTYTQGSSISEKELQRIKPEVKAPLQGYLDQPSLRGVQLLGKFNSAVATNQSGNGNRSSFKDHWSAQKSYTCKDIAAPSSQKLTLDSRQNSLKTK